MLAKWLRLATLNRENANQPVFDHERNRNLTVGIRQAGHGYNFAEFSGPSGFLHLATYAREIGLLSAQMVHTHQPPPLGNRANHSDAHCNRATKSLILIAAACHNPQSV